MRSRLLLPLMLAAAAVALPVRDAAADAPKPWEPYTGYVYPAGGERGSVFRVRAGGQNLGAVTGVHVTGEGVTAELIRYEGGYRRLNGDQRRELKRRLIALRRRAETGEEVAPPDTTPSGAAPSGTAKPAPPKKPRAELPKHPLLSVLDTLSPRELDMVESRFLTRDPKRQPNAQISERVLVEVSIAPDAAPGLRDLRLVTRNGLSNPVRFEVGTLPEVREEDEPAARAGDALLVPPVLVNGQVLPGEVDRIRFLGRRGQRLVVETHARRLVPYLADAVPGWFQAVVCLRDADGVEIAFADDFRFDPDPVLLCEIPRDGPYTLEIRDAIYRGREDFVYRVAVSERPFLTGMFPLGGRVGAATVAALVGWHLPEEAFSLDVGARGDCVRWAATQSGGAPSNRLPYEVDALPECLEDEPNDDAARSNDVVLPIIVNGLVSRPGDVDVFAFDGNAGDELVVEVRARRLQSPLDSIVRVVDDAGEVVAWNDDHEDRSSGLLTHHADSYLRVKLPHRGVFYVHLLDAQGHGGETHAYRLRVGRPQPDFAVLVTPASLSVRAGLATPARARVFRKDGFDGDVELSLVGAPDGFALAGAHVPRGRDSVRFTLSAPATGRGEPFALHLVARSRIGGKTVERSVVPAQDVMQAFIYRHLPASQELVALVLGGRGAAASVQMPPGGVVPIPIGGTARVRVDVTTNRRRQWRLGGGVQLRLSNPPAGLAIGKVSQSSGGLSFEVTADAAALAPGTEGTLIVEVLGTVTRPKGKGRKKKREKRSATRQVLRGYLPAIPFRIAPRR